MDEGEEAAASLAERHHYSEPAVEDDHGDAEEGNEDGGVDEELEGGEGGAGGEFVCSVCGDDETEEDNPIILCDGGCGKGECVCVCVCCLLDTIAAP